MGRGVTAWSRPTRVEPPMYLPKRISTATHGVVTGESSVKAAGRDGSSGTPGVDRVRSLVASFVERHGGAENAVVAASCKRERISLGAINVAYAFGEGAIDLERREDKGISVSASCTTGRERFGVLGERFTIAATELPALVGYLEGLVREHGSRRGNENGLISQLAILRRWSS